jgi:hypothetical protein
MNHASDGTLGTTTRVFEEAAHSVKQIGVGGKEPGINGVSYVAVLWLVEEMRNRRVSRCSSTSHAGEVSEGNVII